MQLKSTLLATLTVYNTAIKPEEILQEIQVHLFLISHAVSCKLWREGWECIAEDSDSRNCGKAEMLANLKMTRGKDCATLQHPHALLFNSH